MITNLRLKSGRVPGAAPQTIQLTPVTVFVGPNNSGKSQALSELHRWCTSGQPSITDVIVDALEFEGFTSEAAEDRISDVTLKPHPGESLLPEHVLVGKRGSRMQVNRKELLASLQSPNERLNHYCSSFLQFNTLILDGQSRIGLISQQPAGDLLAPPHSSFQTLFRDDERRAEVRRIVHEAFDVSLVIDPTNLGHLRLRLSQHAPASPLEERGIHEEAVDFHSRALPIERASDGVKAFAGMITETVAGDPAILLIDEPEAFLHPALSFKLGLELSKATLGSSKRLFVATHSATFVMGCIQSGAPVNIVRLTYRGDVATSRVLPNEEILRLMRNPLLRSTGVISGLFYEFVIVTESDSDRAFYQEINERLVRGSPERGVPNCLFLNAQNKQTVQTIMRPLRELGIPAAGLVDIDILKEGGKVWSSFLESGFLPDIDRNSLATTRSSLMPKFEATGSDMKRDGGESLLQGSDHEALTNLFEKLEEYGLYVVRGGELEAWLKPLGASGHGPTWLVDIFEKMGEDPNAHGYLLPESDDVWDFVARIREWLMNPNRKGIPT